MVASCYSSGLADRLEFQWGNLLLHLLSVASSLNFPVFSYTWFSLMESFDEKHMFQLRCSASSWFVYVTGGIGFWSSPWTLNPKHFLVFWCLNAAYRSWVFNSVAVFLGFRAFYDWVFDQSLQSSPGEAFQGQACIQALIALWSTVPGYWFTVVCLHQYHQALDHPELKGFFFTTFFMLVLSFEDNHLCFALPQQPIKVLWWKPHYFHCLVCIHSSLPTLTQIAMTFILSILKISQLGWDQLATWSCSSCWQDRKQLWEFLDSCMSVSYNGGT